MLGRSHVYIYDEFLGERKYERVLALIESRLALLDLQGAVARLSSLRGTREIVSSLVKDGVTTVVIVGDDRTVDKVMWFLPELSVTVAFIPVRVPQETAKLLGIPMGMAACDVLAARHVEALDVGTLNDRFFLVEVFVPQSVAWVEVPGQFTVRAVKGGSISIKNLGADAHDGLLELSILPQQVKKVGWLMKPAVQVTRLLVSRAIITAADTIEAQVDHHILNGVRFEVGVLAQKLRFITGRNRPIAK